MYATVAAKRQRDADAEKTSKESEAVGDQTWISRLYALTGDFNLLQRLSDERFERLVEIETLITEHVSWDHQVVRLLRQHNILVDDPPSLVYVRRKLHEAQEREKRQSDNGETIKE